MEYQFQSTYNCNFYGKYSSLFKVLGKRMNYPQEIIIKNGVINSHSIGFHNNMVADTYLLKVLDPIICYNEENT